MSEVCSKKEMTSGREIIDLPGQKGVIILTFIIRNRRFLMGPQPILAM